MNYLLGFQLIWVYTSEWAISIAYTNGIDSNLDIYPPPHEDPLLIRDALFYPNTSWIDFARNGKCKTEVDMTLPYRMLLTRLFEHVRVTHPYAVSDDHYLVDHVMISLSERRVFRIMPSEKRPRLPTPTPSESSKSTSSSTHQEEENDHVNNFTLDPIPYIDQLLPVEGV
ncbi:hypothetical protein Tco_0428667 [Tanacetum coccineum]